MRSARQSWFSSVGVVALLGLAAPHAARADEVFWDRLEESTYSVARLAKEWLDGGLGPVAGTGATFDEVEVFARDEADRQPLAEKVGMAVEKAKEALSAAGLELEGFDRLSILWGRAKTGPSGAALSPSGTRIYWRERTTALAPAPEVRRPPDGPPTFRAAVAASDRVLAAFDDALTKARSKAGPGSLSNAVARALLRHVTLPDSTPPWLREGLVAWLEGVAFPDALEVPLHACGGVASTTAFLSPQARPTAAQARLAGILVTAALSGASDAPTRVARLSSAGADAGKVLAEMIGGDPAAIVTAAVKKGGGERPRCEASGTVACPFCKGSRKLDVACGVCQGLGNLTCPSCDGDSHCAAPGCCDGTQVRTDGLYDCKACDGTGWGDCRTCFDKPRFPCKVCGGSGKSSRECLVCRGKGRVPCPDGGEVEDVDATPARCPWCYDPNVHIGCGRCFGSGFSGCRTCLGTGQVACPECHGLGCAKCGRKGSRPCPNGQGWKIPCTACAGKGTASADPDACHACSGVRTAVDATLARARARKRSLGIDADLRAKNAEVVGKAVRFLLSCVAATDEFALRQQRWIPTGALGKLGKPTFYSNAEVLSALLSSRVGPDRPEVSKALKELRGNVRSLLEGTLPRAEIHVQSVSLALRALVAAADEADRPLVEGLVKRLVSAQRPTGHWADDLDAKEPGDAYASLYAVESLWLASRMGYAVPSETWSRAYTAASKITSAIPKSMRKDGWLTGTDVASSAALIVLAKAGSLGARAKNLDEYRSLPQVAQALAWLDRHFELAHEPTVVSGARVRPGGGDGGWAAWLYALERLARLLSIEEFGGRRWYPEGCGMLAELQYADGEFEEKRRGRMNGPVRTTTSVLLFLSRATPPLTGEEPPDSDASDTSDEKTGD